MAQTRRTLDEAQDLNLGALGLDAAASAVYGQLLRAPDADALDIAKSTHASRASVEAALSQLIRAGLARSADRPSGVEALRPEAALAQQISLKQRDAVDHVSRLTELREEITDLERLWRRHHRGEVESGEFEIVRGLDAINARLDALFASATTSLVGATRVNPRSDGVIEGDHEVVAALVGRGVAVRSIGELAGLESNAGRAYWRRNSEIGEQARFVVLTPIQFRLIDDSVAVLPVDPTNTLLGVVVTRSAGVVLAVREVFESLWREGVSMPVDASPRMLVPGVHSSLPSLLASGACDDAIARTLDVSSRTVRRQVAVLMDEYGAQSRLQLGVALERRGLLGLTPPLPSEHRH